MINLIYRENSQIWIVPYIGDASECVGVGDREHREEAFTRSKVWVANWEVVLLASSVEDVDANLLVVNGHFFAVRVGFCGFIILNELYNTETNIFLIINEMQKKAFSTI